MKDTTLYMMAGFVIKLLEACPTTQAVRRLLSDGHPANRIL